ncbi:sensor histidine kinase [Parvicella tangerina]|uniref:histidine kinase n=1 Tax=Parvicella tangerina TaxID=2829795 RepID=A0A916JNH4_9FLAO|nr:HAMP domain-containing sensor histidine kinase [Parvicella tangerina]CAG5082868.1 Adaptive-response sensory-kinase SasA [Parvicella tangerina]
MKLIKKTNRNFILILLGVIPLAIILLFFSLTYYMADEVDEKLRVDELRIVEQLKTNPEFISIYPVIEVEEIQSAENIEEGIKDVLVYDPIEKEEEPFRELISVKEVNRKIYLIKVRHSTIESKDFMIAIILSMGVILLLIFLLLLVFNNRLSLKLWKPFYNNIDELRTFSFTSTDHLDLKDSDIDEFQDLKHSLELLTEQLHKDYKTLKEFTENASHEIQTPLSIISMNLDEVLQEEHSKENYDKLYACYQSVQRLSKLNQKLLLLAKIDNQQFNDVSEIEFNSLIKEKSEELEQLIEQKDLNVNIVEEGKLRVEMDSILANVLVINLLSNAIKHSLSGSNINIIITGSYFSISNPTEIAIDEKQVFERFKKGNDADSSTGLGLSIVKRIVDLSNMEIEVTNKQGDFKISVKK